MENLLADLSAKESQISLHVIPQVRDIVVAFNEPKEVTKHLIRELAIENQIKPELLLFH